MIPETNSEKNTQRLTIDSLEYLAFEGGGGKGAVYKGAIEALEELLETDWEGPSSKLFRFEDGAFLKWNPELSFYERRAILDYSSDGRGTPKIKGISGASAGAITAFPLALGLTSEDILRILKRYPFNEEFLPNTDLHPGKYRMVGMDQKRRAKLLIAEDKWRILGQNKLEQYVFSSDLKQKIGSNFVKDKLRGFCVREGLRIVLTGLKKRFDFVKGENSFFNQIILMFSNQDIPAGQSDVSPTATGDFIKGFLNWFELFSKRGIDIAANNIDWVAHQLLAWLLRKLPIKVNRWKLFGIFPSNNIIRALSNLIWDRGVFAGFETRDFFYRIILLALSKDTHFRRGFLKSSLLSELVISPAAIESLKIIHNEKFEFFPKDPNDDNSAKTLKKLAQLPEILTFSKLFEITGVDLAICVTNATTSQPLYFSKYFTPDFPVVESLGASMNFPIAFKPIYNEADVFRNESLSHPTFVKFEKHGEVFKQHLSMDDFNTGLGYVLDRIKAEFSLRMSTNGNLSFRSFLPYLRRILDNKSISAEDSNLFYFYYNSAFKGLLIDGGATNNLPIAIFTFVANGKIQQVEEKQKVLSLKLDGSFPPEIKKVVRDILKTEKGAVSKLLSGTDSNESNWASGEFARKLFRTKKLKTSFSKYEASLPDASKLTQPVWVKIGKELLQEYKSSKRGFTPWNRQVGGISGLFSSLQFGFDQGQIEDVTDNENMIPLYCYGIDTLDFDLKGPDMKALVEYSNAAGKQQVKDFFKHPQPATSD